MIQVVPIWWYLIECKSCFFLSLSQGGYRESVLRKVHFSQGKPAFLHWITLCFLFNAQVLSSASYPQRGLFFRLTAQTSMEFSWRLCKFWQTLISPYGKHTYPQTVAGSWMVRLFPHVHWCLKNVLSACSMSLYGYEWCIFDTESKYILWGWLVHGWFALVCMHYLT